MKKNKLDPRTGTISLGPHIPKSNHPEPSHSVNLVSQSVNQTNMDKLMEVIRQMSKVIVEELQKAQPVVVQNPHVVTQGLQKEHRNVNIAIDESIADVGLGKTKDFKTNAEAKPLGKKKTTADKKLSAAKKKLQALKKRGK